MKSINNKVLMTSALATICVLFANAAYSKQTHIESAEKVVACAYPKQPETKAAACEALNDSEKRILNCATKRVNGSRMANCKLLSDSELRSVPIIDAHRPVGTTFNLGPVRKMGQ